MKTSEKNISCLHLEFFCMTITTCSHVVLIILEWIVEGYPTVSAVGITTSNTPHLTLNNNQSQTCFLKET